MPGKKKLKEEIASYVAGRSSFDQGFPRQKRQAAMPGASAKLNKRGSAPKTVITAPHQAAPRKRLTSMKKY